MSMPDQMPLAEVKNRLSEGVDRLEREHGHGIASKHGRPAAVVISVENLQSLEERLDIMNSAALPADIRESLAELSAGGADIIKRTHLATVVTSRHAWASARRMFRRS